MINPTEKSAILIEALPYLQRFRGETFLIKAGGSAMESPALVRKLMRDIVFLEAVGINPVIVHGGGKAISNALSQAGIQTEFLDGLRITTPEAMSIVEDTLHNRVNADLVSMLNEHGGKAHGIKGNDVFQSQRIRSKKPPYSLGCVGEVLSCHLEDISALIAREIVPVISPLGQELSSSQTLNINADLAASALACALKPAKLVFLSDVPGLLQDPNHPESLIPSVSKNQTQELIKQGVISGGMLPKIQAALEALEAGVQKVHFIDGRLAHSLLLEIFTSSGIGTEILP